MCDSSLITRRLLQCLLIAAGQCCFLASSSAEYAYLNNPQITASHSEGYYCESLAEDQFKYLREVCIKDFAIRWQNQSDEHGPVFEISNRWQLEEEFAIRNFEREVRFNLSNAPDSIREAFSILRLGFGSYIVLDVVHANSSEKISLNRNSADSAGKLVAKLKLMLRPTQRSSNFSSPYSVSYQWSKTFLPATLDDACNPKQNIEYLDSATTKNLINSSFYLTNLKICNLNFSNLEKVDYAFGLNCQWQDRKNIPQCERDLQITLQQQKINQAAKNISDALDVIDQTALATPIQYPVYNIQVLANLNAEHPIFLELRDRFMNSIETRMKALLTQGKSNRVIELLHQARAVWATSPVIATIEGQLLAQGVCYFVFEKKCKTVIHGTRTQMLPFRCPAEGGLSLDHISTPATVTAANSELRMNKSIYDLGLAFHRAFNADVLEICRKDSAWKNKTYLRLFDSEESLNKRIESDRNPKFSQCIEYKAQYAIDTLENPFCEATE